MSYFKVFTTIHPPPSPHSDDLLITVNIYCTGSVCQAAPRKVINPDTTCEISSPRESWDLLL